jgi:hypothetical protein
MDDLIKWLLDSDVSVQYQVYRDLLKKDRPDLRKRIEHEGWGAKFLSCRKENGHWGQGFYQTKWVSSHYTLLDLKNLGISPDQKEIRETIAKILAEVKARDGGVNPHRSALMSDVCVNGMLLNYASYFRSDGKGLHSIVDFILSQHMADGGFNCESNGKGASHSSIHTTLSVLEGILEYAKNGYTYRLPELLKAAKASEEFLLVHRLFRSHRTGEIIDKKMLMLSYPSRWRYDILRALDYYRSAGIAYDNLMQYALDVLRKKRRPDGKWLLQARHAGKTHFEMEAPGKPSRWNTLRAMRVLKHFGAF